MHNTTSMMLCALSAGGPVLLPKAHSRRTPHHKEFKPLLALRSLQNMPA